MSADRMIPVPASELEALRHWQSSFAGPAHPRRWVLDALVARIPEPPDPAVKIIKNYLANALCNDVAPKADDIVFYLRQAGLLREDDR